MTIAISLKVNDGIVLAADSASTLLAQLPNGQVDIINVYNNANKISNLLKGSPIGLITWGSGSIGASSTSTLAKDLRRRFMGDDPTHPDWKLDAENINLEHVAQRVKEFMFDEHYQPAFAQVPQSAWPALGFIIAGYSSGSSLAEEYQIDIQNGNCLGPRLVRPKEHCGLTWSGNPEAITRLVWGFSPTVLPIAKDVLKVSDEQIQELASVLNQNLMAQVVFDPMPIQDAIDLAEFLVELTMKFSRFTPGAQTVGGPVEIAAVTKHEGFKWIKRKHYFSTQLNPGDPNYK